MTQHWDISAKLQGTIDKLQGLDDKPNNSGDKLQGLDNKLLDIDEIFHG